jgi:SAM-dependent methyltransferase
MSQDAQLDAEGDGVEGRPAEEGLDSQLESNRRLWDEWTGYHVNSDFYDVEGFVADPASSPLDPIVRGVVGDVSDERLLHLQCHFGMDTLRLALMGAHVTGVDFSSAAIAEARRLSERSAIPATFVESSVLELPESVQRGGFDIVFTSYGVISWLHDLEAWARSVSTRLAPGGVFHIIEMHPTLWVFDEESDEVTLQVRYPYFGREPLPWEEHGSYAAPDADVHSVSYSWQHTFEEIIAVLLAEGLVIEELREYPRIAWQHMPSMTRDADGLWSLPPEAGDIPLMFSLSARKPRDSAADGA